MVLLTSEGHWLYGVVANNVWSFAGPGDAAPINQMLVQYFINYNFEEGWYATTSPDITANWKASNNNRWTVPFGGGFGKIFKIGDQATERPGAGVLQRRVAGQRRRQLDDSGAVAVSLSQVAGLGIGVAAAASTFLQ